MSDVFALRMEPGGDYPSIALPIFAVFLFINIQAMMQATLHDADVTLRGMRYSFGKPETPRVNFSSTSAHSDYIKGGRRLIRGPSSEFRKKETKLQCKKGLTSSTTVKHKVQGESKVRESTTTSFNVFVKQRPKPPLSTGPFRDRIRKSASDTVCNFSNTNNLKGMSTSRSNWEGVEASISFFWVWTSLAFFTQLLPSLFIVCV